MTDRTFELENFQTFPLCPSLRLLLILHQLQRRLDPETMQKDQGSHSSLARFSSTLARTIWLPWLPPLSLLSLNLPELMLVRPCFTVAQHVVTENLMLNSISFKERSSQNQLMEWEMLKVPGN